MLNMPPLPPGTPAKTKAGTTGLIVLAPGVGGSASFLAVLRALGRTTLTRWLAVDGKATC